MPGYEDLNKYIEQNEHTLHTINKSNLKRNIFLNDKLNNHSLHLDKSLSISDQLDFCIEKLKQNQLLRTNQLKKINHLFELDINIEDEINLDINSIQDESRRYDEYDFEAFLIGKHLDSDIQQHYLNSSLETVIDRHDSIIKDGNKTIEGVQDDISDIFLKNIDILRINRKNKLKYIAQSLSNLNVGSSDVLNNATKYNNNNEICESNKLFNNSNHYIIPNNNSLNNQDSNIMNQLVHENNNIDIITLKNNEMDCINIPHNIIFDPSMKLSPCIDKNFITLESIAENISEW